MLQIGAALFYYKLGKALLQIGAASLLQTGASNVTDCSSYYRSGQLLKKYRAAFTNCGKIYYKWGQLLQIRATIKNCGILYKAKNVRELSCLTFLIRWAGQRVVDYLKKSKNSYHFFYFNILLPSPSTRLTIFPKLFPNLSLVRFQVFGVLIPLTYLPS